MGASKGQDVHKNENEAFVRREAHLSNSEDLVRKTASSGLRAHALTAPFVDAYAALLVFIFHLISIESLVAIGLSVFAAIYCYQRSEDNYIIDGAIMNWVLLSFAVITPLSSSIGMAFQRRDQALNLMASMKSTMLHIYSAHVCWDWALATGKKGRSSDYDWLGHSDAVLELYLQLSHELGRLLTLPTPSKAWHRVTSRGRREAAMTEKVLMELHVSISDHICHVTQICEKFKYQGLPPNEATRIRMWERMMAEKIETLIVLKRYRTPQALRSFARVFSVVLPPFYGPFYAQMAKDLNSLAMAIAFAVITAIALTSLFETVHQMEDPFVGNLKLDNIDVFREFEVDLKRQLLSRRRRHFKDAPPFKGKDPVDKE